MVNLGWSGRRSTVGVENRKSDVALARRVSSSFGGLFSPVGAFLGVGGGLALRGAWWGFHVEHAVLENALAALESSFA